jgi:hypothetical protein
MAESSAVQKCPRFHVYINIFGLVLQSHQTKILVVVGAVSFDARARARARSQTHG